MLKKYIYNCFDEFVFCTIIKKKLMLYLSVDFMPNSDALN